MQDRFWAMHDLIFQNQRALDDESPIGYAREAGIDAERVARELAEGTYAERVRNDFSSGARSGVNGTPTIFINGGRYDGRWDAAEQFAEALRTAPGG